MNEVVRYALLAMNAIPQIVAGIQSVQVVAETVQAHVDETNALINHMVAENRAPTVEEWAGLAQKISDRRAQLHAIRV
jgi:ABC-type phosphate transport system permease subunit